GPGDLPRHLVEGPRHGRGGEPRRREAAPQRALGDPPDARGAAEPRLLRRAGGPGRGLRHPGGDRGGRGPRSRQPRRDRLREHPARTHPERHLRHRGRRPRDSPRQRERPAGGGPGRLSGTTRVGGTLRVVGEVLRRLRPYRWAFAVAVLQVLLIGLLELAKPWPLKIVVDNVLGGGPPGLPPPRGRRPPPP